ncbi:acetyl-CoA carboxylase biotin carboxylase subunit family protein [Nonomuraea sp. NPDC049400]|uniref:acetyl-CoA carboxylase biotin carboxylase subunit family protein n=1 Tax=Nonomuraea sp. NPDC049400 TaxID=3364352 RepID=UPI0037BD300E
MAEPVFVLPESEHNTGIRDLIEDVAEVCDLDAAADAKVAGVVTFSDFQLEAAAVLAERLGLAFHPVDVARTLTRKHLQRAVLNKRGVGHTPSALVTDLGSAELAAEQVGFPAVLKPNRGVGGTHTYPVADRAELLDLVAALMSSCVPPDDGYVLEARLAPADVRPPWGGFVSVESLIREGEVTHVGITGKFGFMPPFRERGGYLPPLGGIVDEPAILDVTTRALHALGVGDSICHTEVMVTAAGPRIIEVNGRMGGHIHDLFRRAHGLDLIALAARVALGDPAPVALVPCGEVVYQYFGLAPIDAKILLEAPHVAEVRKLPEVSRFDLQVPPGSDLDWRRGFRERIYVCRGQVPDHERLAAFIESLNERLGIRYA